MQAFIKLQLLFFVCVSLAVSQDSLSLRFTTSSFDNIQQGIPFDVQWTGASGVADLYVVNADEDPNSNTVLTIASNLTRTEYRWTPPYLPARNIYALRITDSEGNENFSPTWRINDTISSSTLSTRSASSTQTATETSSQTPTQASSHSGLSTGAVAGIAVAAVLAGIGAVIGIVLFFIKRKKTRSSEQSATESNRDKRHQVEMGGTAVSEMETSTDTSPLYRNQASELASPLSSASREVNGLRQELPGADRYHERENVYEIGHGHGEKLADRNVLSHS